MIHRLRQRVEELGLVQWGKALQESLQDLSTATALLKVHDGEAAVKGSGPVN